ncbi:bifunctional DNA primase/polymerase [Rhodococcus sp. HNM0569]|uniref:bifunctional DNA primase/polymerase n=1 Tax=Rhodococcus sp. HNM0569 TaxID=2716340 RepID=UPI00197E9B85|nr:bifunctional DNA primase/polymerase [Rhodococcus sp. HNM0569]
MVAVDVLTGVLAQVSDGWPLSVAAREFAVAGVPVFPCVPGGKRPLTEHGFHDATTDTDQVAAWWGRYSAANIGMPTGAVSGVVVVDVHGPVNGFDAFDRAHEAGLVDGWQLLVSTPSGGMHAYHPATPDGGQRSWQAPRAGVDFRGDGGYIIVPPSAVAGERGRGCYRVRQINTGHVTTVTSDRLRDFLGPRPTPAMRPAGQVRDVSAERLAAWVAERPEGERNRGLFWAACRLAENNTPPTDAYAALAPAAEHAGLTMREVSATIRSAYRTAQPAPHPSADQHGEEPRRVPQRATERVLS